MKIVKKKLSSESGVSILIALLLFLFVSIVSVTILTAANTAINRTYQTQRSTQSTLYLESAALMIRQEFDGSSGKEVTVTDKNAGTSQTEVTVDEAAAFAPEINALIAYADDYENDSFRGSQEITESALIGTTSFNVTPESDAFGSETPQVNVTLNFYRAAGATRHYEMVAILKSAEDEEAMYMDFDISYNAVRTDAGGNVVLDDDTGSTTRIQRLTETYTWSYVRTENTEDRARGDGSE